MKVASGLAFGQQARSELAELAIREALAQADLTRADSVLLFLTRDFANQAQAAIVAAARAAGSLQIFGCTTSGLFTERQVLLDQSGAAALVIGETMAGTATAESTILSFSGHSALPFNWQNDTPRVGLLDTNAQAWAHARLSTNACAEFPISGQTIRQALSTGLQQISPPLPVDESTAYELRRVAGLSAVASLRRSLPGELPPLHKICLLRQASEQSIDILAINADGSLTLAETLENGEEISWASRQPLSSEQDMRRALNAASLRQVMPPDFALMFSCIGRGPLFYGSEDRDLLAFREHFPGLPLLGAYGNGQIASHRGRNRLFHNAAITLLIEGSHV